MAPIQQATFPFLGAPTPVVDAAWTLARTDAITHVLVEADSGRAAAQQQSHAHGASPGVAAAAAAAGAG